MQITTAIAFATACVFGSATLSAQGPLPEFYGVYALQDGKLTELMANADQNDFGSTVKFVVFWRGSVQPVQNMFFIPPEKPRDSRSGEFKGWDDWFRQTQAPGNAMEKAVLHGVPANAVEIPFRVGPYGGSSEMIRVVPSKDLPPGLYQLLKGVRFWVRKSEVASIYDQAAQLAQRTTGDGTNAPVRQQSAGNQPEIKKNLSTAISSGSNVKTKFGISNQSSGAINLFLDGSETPITITGGNTFKDMLEIGSTHFLKVVAGNIVYEAQFTVQSGAKVSHYSILPGVSIAVWGFNYLEKPRKSSLP